MLSLAPMSPSLPCHVCSSSCHCPCLMLPVFPLRSCLPSWFFPSPSPAFAPVTYSPPCRVEPITWGVPGSSSTTKLLRYLGYQSHLCNPSFLVYEMHTGHLHWGDWGDSASLFLGYVQLDMAIWANIFSNHVTLTLVQSRWSPPHCCSLPAPTSSSLPWRQSHTMYHA